MVDINVIQDLSIALAKAKKKWDKAQADLLAVWSV